MAESVLSLLPHGKEQNHRSRSSSLDSTRTSIDIGQLPKSELKESVRKKEWWSIYPVIALLVLVGTTGVALLAYQHNFVANANTKHLEPSLRKYCGNSTSSALKNDCVLDFIAGAWIPRACYDSELEAEFLELRQWEWYTDAHGSRSLSLESLKSGGGPNPIFVSLDYHWIHCAYTWRKLHRSMISGRPIDTHIGEYEHTKHCADGLSARRDDNETRPVARFYQHFESCVV